MNICEGIGRLRRAGLWIALAIPGALLWLTGSILEGFTKEAS